MNCKTCNNPLGEDALFCPECGAAVEGAPEKKVLTLAERLGKTQTEQPAPQQPAVVVPVVVAAIPPPVVSQPVPLAPLEAPSPPMEPTPLKTEEAVWSPPPDPKKVEKKHKLRQLAVLFGLLVLIIAAVAVYYLYVR